MVSSEECMKMESTYGAHNYHPIPVVISRAEGLYVWDPEGKRYMDMLSCYSALNQGHRNPKIIKAAIDQMEKLTLTSRAFYNDQLGPFLKKITEISGMEMALPMNTGAEAVETGIKLARRWAYRKKGVPTDQAEIIVCADNFHGRTTTIAGFSSDPDTYDDFGPFTPGFKAVPYGNAEALEAAITPNTAAFIVEPIQGEAGVVVPPAGYLKEVREICTRHNVLMIADEIQTGLCRTGKMFCFQHDDIKPDVVFLAKALGGGIMPISVVLSSKEIMSVFTPGSHGSTFGGNPLACAVAMASLDVLIDEKLDIRAQEMGGYFMQELTNLNNPLIKLVRGKGLLIAIELMPEAGPARKYTEGLMQNGLLAKETHSTIIRFAPSLLITKEQIDDAIVIIKGVFEA